MIFVFLFFSLFFCTLEASHLLFSSIVGWFILNMLVHCFAFCCCNGFSEIKTILKFTGKLIVMVRDFLVVYFVIVLVLYSASECQFAIGIKNYGYKVVWTCKIPQVWMYRTVNQMMRTLTALCMVLDQVWWFSDPNELWSVFGLFYLKIWMLSEVMVLETLRPQKRFKIERCFWCVFFKFLEMIFLPYAGESNISNSTARNSWSGESVHYECNYEVIHLLFLLKKNVIVRQHMDDGFVKVICNSGLWIRHVDQWRKRVIVRGIQPV